MDNINKARQGDSVCIFDFEIYKNYSLFYFYDLKSEKARTFEIWGANNSLKTEDRHKMFDIINNRTAGYNSVQYDLPIAILAINGLTASELQQFSTLLIEGNQQWSELAYKDPRYSHYFSGYTYKRLDHVDLLRAAMNRMGSLKVVGARMHNETIQELPYSPHLELTREQADKLKEYCFNDIKITAELYNRSLDRINLRRQLSKAHNINFLSYSDPMISEALTLESLGVKQSYNDTAEEDTKAEDIIPILQLKKADFKSQQLKDLYDLIESVSFCINDTSGKLILPAELQLLEININGLDFTIGVGGLHSQESKQVVEPSDSELLIDADVTSYYPNLIINNGLYPEKLGRRFLDMYRDTLVKRVEYKNAKKFTESEVLKIVLNGTYGKLGSKYSALYSPVMLLSTCLNGQLNLLLLIEMLTDAGFKVVSANTDGVVTLLNKSDKDLYYKICKDWENKTSYNLEYSKYKGLYSRDVNNYFAVLDDGKVKKKGVFAGGNLRKNPQGEICYNAVIDLITKKIPIEETIKNCDNIRLFLYVRKVNGGAEYMGEPVGSVVRWYYAPGDQCITYLKNGNKVARSDGAKLLQKINAHATMESYRIDYERYIKDSYKILKSELGVKNYETTK